jgi:putative transposase
MREHDLQPKRCRRLVATTDSGHKGPIFPDLARDRIVDGPNQLWVADITYIAIATGFVYLAAILDAWWRRVVDQPLDRCARCRGGAESGYPNKAAAEGLHPPLGSRFAIRFRALSVTCWPNTVSSAPWADVAIPMTMPRPRAL